MKKITLIVIVAVVMTLSSCISINDDKVTKEELEAVKLELQEDIIEFKRSVEGKVDTVGLNVDSLKTGQALIYKKLDDTRKPLFNIKF